MKTCPQCNLVYPSESSFCFLDGSTLIVPKDPRIGSTLAGRYVIEEALGVGGMATVYLGRALSVAGFQRLVQPTGLEAGPPPQVPEAVWELPPGVALKDWTAQDVPPGAGLQANGALGATIVWLKWYEGRMFLVATVSSP